MRSWLLSFLAAGLGLALGLAGPACSDATGSVPGATMVQAYVTVDVDQAYEQLTADAEAQVVDVREQNEWAATGVISDAVLIPLGELQSRAPDELAIDEPVYVICNSGNRSRTGSEILVELGYSEVYNVDGGIQAWMRAGLPLESYQP